MVGSVVSLRGHEAGKGCRHMLCGRGVRALRQLVGSELWSLDGSGTQWQVLMYHLTSLANEDHQKRPRRARSVE
jgi:hypothetical protein